MKQSFLFIQIFQVYKYLNTVYLDVFSDRRSMTFTGIQPKFYSILMLWIIYCQIHLLRIGSKSICDKYPVFTKEIIQELLDPTSNSNRLLCRHSLIRDQGFELVY